MQTAGRRGLHPRQATPIHKYERAFSVNRSEIVGSVAFQMKVAMRHEILAIHLCWLDNRVSPVELPDFSSSLPFMRNETARELLALL